MIQVKEVQEYKVQAYPLGKKVRISYIQEYNIQLLLLEEGPSVESVSVVASAGVKGHFSLLSPPTWFVWFFSLRI